LESLLAGYVLGDLTPEEVAHVKQLLETDLAIKAEVERLQSTLALLPLSLPESTPPQQLQSRILQEARTDLTLSLDTTLSHPGSMRCRQWSIVVGSIAALAIAALGLQTWQLRYQLATAQADKQKLQQDLKVTQAELDQIRQNDLAMTQKLSRYQQTVNLLQEPNNRFLSLKGTSPKSDSTGSLLIAPKSDKAVLVLRDVEPLPAGKVYRMWAIVNGKKVSCMDFAPNEQGEVFLEVPLDQLGAATEVVVTIEPDRYSPQPVGEMVITGS
jgi:cell division protein FtsB